MKTNHINQFGGFTTCQTLRFREMMNTPTAWFRHNNNVQALDIAENAQTTKPSQAIKLAKKPDMRRDRTANSQMANFT